MEQQQQQQHPPSLSLQFLQGPRKGETLTFQPGSAIKIGRVIRGNTLPIKDPGISTKHLSIQIESDSKWILRDLDSSNGTVFDGNTIPPNTPFHLRDGSTIKIGEVTSILVNFIYPQNNPTSTVIEDKPVRGRKGNKGLKARVPILSIDENEILSDSDESEYVPEPKKVTRNTRNTRSRNNVSDVTVGNLDVEEPKKTRVTRNSKNAKKTNENYGSGIGNSDAPEEKVEEPKKNTRVTRNLRNKQKVIEISESSSEDSDVVKEKVEEQKNKRVARNSKNKGSVIGENSSLVDRVDNVEKKKTRVGAKGKKKLEENFVGDGDGKETCDDGREKGKKKLVEECVGDGDGKEKENLNVDGNLPDLEKMTLGEWFDFLEVYLPKQIIDSTEEMFDSMRQKAERLREYVIMYQTQKLDHPPE